MLIKILIVYMISFVITLIILKTNNEYTNGFKLSDAEMDKKTEFLILVLLGPFIYSIALIFFILKIFISFEKKN